MPRTSRGLAFRAELEGGREELAEKGGALSEVFEKVIVAVSGSCGGRMLMAVAW